MTFTFIVRLDAPSRTNTIKLESALQRVLELALESDIEGAEILDARIKHVGVTVAP